MDVMHQKRRKKKLLGLTIILLSALFVSCLIWTPHVSASIVNPGFESGTNPWVFYTNGSGTFAISSPGDGTPKAGHISISARGTNVQLYQSGIALEPETHYRLSFKAYSNTGQDLAVSLLKHGSPYTDYGLANYQFDLTSSWSTFSVDFTTEGFTNTVSDGRLMFWLAPFAMAGDHYYLDDIILEKIDTDTLTLNPGFEDGTTPWVFYATVLGHSQMTRPAKAVPIPHTSRSNSRGRMCNCTSRICCLNPTRLIC
jgi:hypothetical protein